MKTKKSKLNSPILVLNSNYLPINITSFKKAFKLVSVDITWKGEGLNEKGIDSKTGKIIIEIDSKYYRPSEVDTLLGDPSKAKDLLGWNPNETSFDKLVELMVYSDINLVEKENK